jgi:hypothetical protein
MEQKQAELPIREGRRLLHFLDAKSALQNSTEVGV